MPFATHLITNYTVMLELEYLKPSFPLHLPSENIEMFELNKD
jgi:hypothetical protein